MALKAILILLLSALAACADTPPVMVRSGIKIQVYQIASMPPPHLGRYSIVGDTCYIALREYPACLAHEVRHCLEGDWHGNSESDKDCY